VADNFWMRAIPQAACSDNDSTDNIKGIVYYGDSPSTPSTTGYSYTDSCDDESLDDLVPYLAIDAGDSAVNSTEPVSVERTDNVFLWEMDSTHFNVTWNEPTLLQVYDNTTSFSNSSHVIELSTADEWVYIVITTTQAVPHPIHLHGHDFFVLAQSTGTYSSSLVNSSSLTNPPRRDTAMLPASGYLVVAFKTDNPGAWLMHCHIGWHTDMGLALQFLERYSVTRDLIDYDTLNSTCSTWDTYASDSSVTQGVYDDGI